MHAGRHDGNSAVDVEALLRRRLPYRTLTRVQATVLPTVLHSDASVLVAAPTGSGKTLLMEAAMLRLFATRLSHCANVAARETTTTTTAAAAATWPLQAKAVYVCPIKALAQEKYTHWRTLFAPLHVVLETGDAAVQDNDSDDDSDEDEEAEAEDDDADGAAVAPRHSRGTDAAQTTRRAAAATTQATVTGVYDADASLQRVAAADIVIATPERWDSITRRCRVQSAARVVVSAVALLLLDEVHTVDEDRGAVLEAVVSRMMAVQSTTTTTTATTTAAAAALRIIAASGTLPNVDDFAAWLHVSRAHVYTFSSADRPVPLRVRVLAYAHDGRSAFAFDRFLSYKLLGLLRQYSAGRPTLVFCLSRRASVATAQQLVADLVAAATRDGRAAQLAPSPEVRAAAARAGDRQLRACLLLGVAFHHAAMTRHDRALVEHLFRARRVAVLCTTTTLALGVNLPAHLVLVKGTAIFGDGRAAGGGAQTSQQQQQHYALSEVTQMCGRAGRPGLDDAGVALVLTTEAAAPRYASLAQSDAGDNDGGGGVRRRVNGDAAAVAAAAALESRLHVHLIEHVNAEVALRTVHDLASALAWLRTTFLWQRLRRCPQHYGVRLAEATAATTTTAQPQQQQQECNVFDAEDYAQRLMTRVLDALARVGCITLQQRYADDGDDDDGATRDAALTRVTASTLLDCTPLGRCMSRLYILYDTVRLFVECATRRTTAAAPPLSSSSPRHTFASTLALLSRSAEFADARLRLGDRGPLNALHRLVPLPLHMATAGDDKDGGGVVGHKRGRRTMLSAASVARRAVNENWHKPYLLVQAYVLQLPVADVSLRNDMLRVWALVPRLAAFLCHAAALSTPSSYSLSRHSDVLLRCVQRRVWPDECATTTATPPPPPSHAAWLRQLRGVSAATAQRLRDAGYVDAASLCAAPSCRLEMVCGRVPPFGAVLRRCAAALLPCAVALVPAAASRSWVVRLTFARARGNDDDDAGGGAATASRQQRLLLVGHVALDVVLLRRLVDVPAAAAAGGEAVVEYAFVLPRGSLVDDVVVHVSVPRLVGCEVFVRGAAAAAAAANACAVTATTAAAAAATPSFDAFLADLRAIDAPAGDDVAAVSSGDAAGEGETAARCATPPAAAGDDGKREEGAGVCSRGCASPAPSSPLPLARRGRFAFDVRVRAHAPPPPPPPRVVLPWFVAAARAVDSDGGEDAAAPSHAALPRARAWRPPQQQQRRGRQPPPAPPRPRSDSRERDWW